MRNRKVATVLAAVATAAVTATTAAPATAAPTAEQQAGNRSLAKVLAADGTKLDRSWKDFDILEKAVTTVLGAKKNSPVAVLAEGKVRLTAFVPTDKAFRKLATELTGKRPATEKATFKALAKAVDVDTLEAVLLYHVVPGATVTYKQARGADGAALETAAGASIEVNTYHRTVRLRDADKDDRNPAVIRALANLNKGNKQIAHGIDAVLRPADLP